MEHLQNHIIRKQTVRVQANTRDAFALRKNIEEIVSELSGDIEQLFDKLSSDGEWMQIGKLDISIDNLREDNLREELTKRVLSALKEKLIACKYEASLAAKGRASESDIYRSKDQLHVQALIFFLEGGILPWWFKAESHTYFEQELLTSLGYYCEIHTSTDAQQLKGKLVAVLIKKNAAKRLAAQFDEDIVLAIVKWLMADILSHGYSEVKSIYQEIKQCFQSYPSFSKKSEAIQLSMSTLINSTVTTKESAMIIQYWIEDLFMKVLKYDIAELSKGLLSSNAVIQYLPANSIVFRKRITEELMLGESESTDAELKGDLSEDRNISGRGDKREAEKDAAAEEYAHVSGSIIDNAGLILVAPFLPELFRKCEVASLKTITDKDKAIAMTHYIVYGNLEYREYDVLLNKVLCGIEPDESIRLVKELNSEEIAEINSMLNAIITYWTVLKNTTVDGLRQGFLQRAGKLEHMYDGWMMHVEKQTIDILMQTIPWTIGMIKLPWMNKMIKTEWI